MTRVQTVFLFLFLALNFQLAAQISTKLLVENRWSGFDHFAVLDFQEDGKVILEYAYCTYCRNNKETLEWELIDNILKIGEDSLSIQTASSSEIIANQYGHTFTLKKLDKVKASKLKKEEIQSFLIAKKPLSVKVVSKKLDNSVPKSIQFSDKGKMWLEMPEYRGQWALKSFYGQLFLIYINRHSVNRDFPLVKINKFKNGKLVGQPIRSIKQGMPFKLEIYK